MDALTWQKAIDEYLVALENNVVYQELVTCYTTIKSKYFYLLSDYYTKKSNLEAANSYYKDYDELKSNYQLAKTRLYEKPEVKQYFRLRHQLEDEINADLVKLYQDVILPL